MDRKKTAQSNSNGYKPFPKPVTNTKQHPQKKRPRKVRGLIPRIRYVLSKVFGRSSGQGGKRSQGNGKRGRKQSPTIPVMGIISLAVVVLIIFGFIRIATAKNAYAIYVGQKRLGAIAMAKNVTEESLAESLFDTAVKKLESEYGGAKLQVEEKVTVEPVHMKKKELVTAEYIVMEIYKSVTYKIEAAVITLSGREMAVLLNQAEADAVLKRIISRYTEEETEVVSEGFVELVSVEPKYVDKGDIVSPDVAYKALIATQDVQETYTVQTGDTLWKIASKSGMTLEELLDKNSDLSMDSVLKVGQEIMYYATKPLLSVKIVEKETYTEEAPMPVEQRENHSEYKTYSKVIQQGKAGVREVTVHITKVNGIDTGVRQEVGNRVTVEPIAEIREVGTSETVPKR